MYALEEAASIHLGLWGTSFFLNLLGQTHGLKIVFAPIAALWIEHMIGNFHFLATLYVTYLFWSADFGLGSVIGYFI